MAFQKIYMNFFWSLALLFFTASPPFAQTPITLGNGQNITSVSSSHNSNTINETVNGEGFLPNEFAASRFLAQATLGADVEAIMELTEESYSVWLDEQFNTPKDTGVYQHMLYIIEAAAAGIAANGGDPNTLNPWIYYWHFAWWQYTMTSPDELRARVGMALSEIFVVSELPDLKDAAMGLASYYEMLLDHSFGNFRDLIEAITFHPSMGVYLTHVNNPKSDTSANQFPDENYAREIMQLFTIGLYELNIDGTRRLDAQGKAIPTYDIDDISEFAKIYTGLSWGDTTEFGLIASDDTSYTVPMQMYNSWHEPGEKHLLNGYTVPDRNPVDGLADIDDALDNLFVHPNVGPFIGRLLIQRMVTSNPSPAYIQRVAEAFNSNGQGIRGDMKAVIRAILLDPEARDCGMKGPYKGMLREPLLRLTHVMRAFNAFSDTGVYRHTMDDFKDQMFQRPLASPSVFNFFQPDYTPIGAIDSAGLVAPEFQITNAVSISGYSNQLYEWVIEENNIMEYRDIYENEYNNDKYVRLDLTDEMALEEITEIDELLERLNLLLMHGQMSNFTREAIRETLSDIPESDSAYRVRQAIYLVMFSPDYLIIR